MCLTCLFVFSLYLLSSLSLSLSLSLFLSLSLSLSLTFFLCLCFSFSLSLLLLSFVLPCVSFPPPRSVSHICSLSHSRSLCVPLLDFLSFLFCLSLWHAHTHTHNMRCTDIQVKKRCNACMICHYLISDKTCRHHCMFCHISDKTCHSDRTCRNTAYYELKCISSIRRYLTEDAAKQLVTSCVLSRLDLQFSSHGHSKLCNSTDAESP